MALKTFDLSGASAYRPSGYQGLNPAQTYYQAKEDALRRRYAPEDYESDIALKKAKADKAQQEANFKKMIVKILQPRGGGQPPGQPPEDLGLGEGGPPAVDGGQTDEAVGGGQTPPGQMPGQSTEDLGLGEGQTDEAVGGAQTDEEYNKQLLELALSNVFGVPFESFQTKDGKVYTRGPSGEWTEKKIGSSEAEVAEEIVKRKNKIAYQKEVSENYETAAKQVHGLRLLSSLMLDPAFKMTTGRIGSVIGEFWPSEKQQDFYGTLEALTKTFGTDLFPLFKGQVTNFHQRYVEGLMPTDKDAWPVFAGKVAGLTVLAEGAMEKNKLVNQYLEKGMGRIEANEKAFKEVSLDKIMERVKRERARKEKELDTPPTKYATSPSGNMWIMTLPDGSRFGVPFEQIEDAKKQEKYAGATFKKDMSKKP